MHHVTRTTFGGPAKISTTILSRYHFQFYFILTTILNVTEKPNNYKMVSDKYQSHWHTPLRLSQTIINVRLSKSLVNKNSTRSQTVSISLTKQIPSTTISNRYPRNWLKNLTTSSKGYRSHWQKGRNSLTISNGYQCY